MFALTWYRNEVNNGGHHQFYLNSTGIVWPDALAALDAIGATEAASVLRAANQRMGGSPARDRGARVAQLRKLSPPFADLDDRFFAVDKDVKAMMLAYVRKNPAAFRYSGKMRLPKAWVQMTERRRERKR